MIWLFASLLVVFAVDRVAKVLVFRRCPVGTSRSVAGFLSIQPVFHRRLRHWPSGSRAAWVSSLALGLAAALAIVAIDPRSNAATALGLGAALGGALGNLYDRLRHGAVLDFLHVGVGGRFNAADVALVAGLATALASHVATAASILSRG